MTAKVSTNNFFTNIKFKVKSNIRIMVILLILHLVSAPLNLINLMVYQTQINNLGNNYAAYPQLNYLYVAIGVVSTILAAAAGIVIAITIFNYLYKKSVVDMTLSLPLTTKQRFFSDFLAGLFIYLVPFIISSIVTLIVNGIGGAVVENWSMGDTAIVSKSIPSLIIIGLLIMIMLYILTVLVLTCCGNMFEAVSYSVLINGLIPGAIAALGYILAGNLYGINFSDIILPIIEKTSPVGAIIGLITNADQIAYSYGRIAENYITIKASWIIPFILVTAVYFSVSFFLYMKRKAEQVSKPFVYKFFYYIMVTSITFCIGTLFTLEGISENIIPLIIITAVIYLIFEVITNRGFKKIYMSVIRYVATIAVVIGLIFAVDKTNCFGAIEKIPEASNVKSIEMNYDGLFNKFNGNAFSSIYTDTETISSVIEMQQTLVNNYKDAQTNNFSKNTYNGVEVYENLSDGSHSPYITDLEIKYNLKSGGTIKREYGVTFDAYIKLMNIDKTEEYKNNYINYFKSYYKSYLKKYGTDNTIDVCEPINYYSDYFSKIDNRYTDEFFDCLEKDIKSLSTEEYYTPTKDPLAKISIGSYNIIINENYSNVLMFLKKYNISLPINNYNNINIEEDRIYVVSPEYAKITLNGTDYFYTHSSKYYYSYYDKPTDDILQVTDEVKELIKHAQSEYFTEEPCYLIVIYSNYYAIPPEYSDLAKTVIEQK